MRRLAKRLATWVVACSAWLFCGPMAACPAAAQEVVERRADSAASQPASAARLLHLGPGLGNGRRRVSGLGPQEPPRGDPAADQPERARDDAPLTPEQADRELARLTRRWSMQTPSELYPGPLRDGRPALSASGLPLASAFRAPMRRRWRLSPPPGLALSDLPIRFEPRTQRYLRYFRETAPGRSTARAWARRAGRYTPGIVAELRKAQLPTDLVWLAMVESGHNPTVRSRAGAAGLWQFMPASAREYGLTVNRWVDERLDPVLSTRAAIRYLTDLKQRFGTWELAMAGYNMGHSGLTRVIRKYNTNDFWQLSQLEAALPWETALYVPKVLAVAIMMRNRAAFGLADVETDAAEGFETLSVPPGVPLAKVAQAAGVDPATLDALNPHYLRGRTPPLARTEAAPAWLVHVPVGRTAGVEKQLASLAPPSTARVARLRRGDTLETLAARLRTTPAELARLNEVAGAEELSAGDPLLCPQPDAGLPPGLKADEEERVLVSQSRFSYRGMRRVFYRTVSGDDLTSIAESFEVSPAKLVEWNSLDDRARLHAGMYLQVFLPQGESPSGVRFAEEKNAGRRLDVGSPSFYSYFEAEKGRRRLQIQAREGDTLSTIGRRFGLSGGMMARINHRGRDKKLHAGAPVVVYARYGPGPTEQLLTRAPSPLPPAAPPAPASLPTAP